MKMLIQKVYWLYKYDRKNITPYTSTVLSLVFLSFLFFIITLLLLGVPVVFVFPFKQDNPALNRWLNGSIYPTIFIVIFLLLNPKSKLEIEPYREQNLRPIRNWLIAIFLILFIIMMILLFRKGINEGLIKPPIISHVSVVFGIFI